MGLSTHRTQGHLSKVIIGILGVITMLGAPTLPANQNKANLESRVKAAFIYRMTKYISWPSDSKEVLICSVGDSEINPFLKPINNKVVGKAKIKLKFESIKSINQGDKCGILYVDKEVVNNIGNQQDQLLKSNVLIIGDQKGFAADQGMVGFVLKQGRVVLEINNTRARLAELKISADLLEIADKVY